MRVVRTIFVFYLAGWFVLPPAAWAQQAHVADRVTIDQAVASHAQQADSDREAIRRMVALRPVREIAARAGIDVRRVETAVATLDGSELRQLADQARQVDDSLAGGQSRVTISTTTIIIGLLLLILIIVAVG